MKKRLNLYQFATICGSVLTVYAVMTMTASAAIPSAISAGKTLPAVIATSKIEISKRQTTLSQLKTTVSSFKYGSPASQQALQTEISGSAAGLAKLQTKIQADTTLAQAQADYQSIFTGYRVYMLVAPKVTVVKAADDQQSKEASLLLAASLLQPYVDASSQSTSLQPKLTTAINQIQQAQKLSQTAESKVLPLVPNDYNSDHQIMKTYFVQLESAKGKLITAYTGLNSIMNSLKQNSAQNGGAVLSITQWGVALPLPSALKTAQYQDITSSYSLPYDTIQITVSGQPAASTCKGGVVGWLQRVPDSVTTNKKLPHAHIGSYNYVSYGVQDCAVQNSEPPLAVQFDTAVTKMVAR